MKFTIQELTNPLTADVLARKDFSFASGGGGGGGGPSTPVIAPHNAALFAAASGKETVWNPPSWVKLASLPMNLRGNRLLRGSISGLFGDMNHVGADPKLAGFGQKTFTWYADPHSPNTAFWLNYCSFSVVMIAMLDGALPDPDNSIGATLQMLNLANIESNDGRNGSIVLSMSGTILKNTTGLAGPHTVDLWALNESEWKYPDVIRTNPNIPAPWHGELAFGYVWWTFEAMEMDVVSV